MALGKKPVQIVSEGEYPLLAKADHWERVPLALVAKVQNGFAFSSSWFTNDDGFPLIRIRDIDSETTENKYKGEFDKEYIVKKDDILIGMDGDFLATKWKGPKGLLNQRVCRIIPTSPSFSEDFLFLSLQPYLNAINIETSSVTVKHLSSRTVEEIPLPLPPLPEQHRIVAKIEALFSELDKGVEQLKTAQQQLKVYRQSVLKWAFGGRLTQQWRESDTRNPKSETVQQIIDRIKQEREAQAKATMKKLKPMAPLTEKELAELPGLPGGWMWVRLQHVSEVSGGLTKHRKREILKQKLPFLRVANVYLNRLELADMHSIGIREEEISRALLAKDDLLFVEGNGSLDQIGRVALWNGAIEDCVHQNHLIKARVGQLIAAKYALYFFCSKKGRDLIRRQATSTSGLHTLSLGKVENLPLPITSFPEQEQIVHQIESRLSVCDKFEEIIALSLQQAVALRQSILKKAFEGKLVPQDPNDEPAEQLLKKITLERSEKVDPRVRYRKKQILTRT